MKKRGKGRATKKDNSRAMHVLGHPSRIRLQHYNRAKDSEFLVSASVCKDRMGKKAIFCGMKKVGVKSAINSCSKLV